MKIRCVPILTASLFLFTGCYTSNKISRFSSDAITLGMNKRDFIKAYGEPFNKDISYTDDNRQEEKFFYKEELYKGAWFIVTTAFTFMDGKLVKQETVKEERQFLGNDRKK